jgi:hypothetical protein
MKVFSKLALLTAATTIALPLSPATAADLYGQWPMSASGNVVPSTTGQADMTLSGSWESTTGAVGDAVRFSAATSYGVVAHSEDANPGTGDFAMGVTFTSDPIADATSGNIMQKGLANKQGQVKISLNPTLGGRTFCRVKGTNGYKILKSKVVEVDDGGWHTAICWREGTTVGLTVDGITVSLVFDPGSVTTTLPIRIGNKSATAGYTDQHFGMNDCSVWALGAGARALAVGSTPC